ncbi:cobaltochelatase subunit CobT [Parvularcula sp. LCG005]|uniref:cobaltochelatase subunit CobT n=1 Tax=Parvularcula sp. LCG005 TaxID=3078805 RepID=UPI002941F7AD|nr:cobaltochelatase subunit CobT [Parvularcula sp. LCG005]WOI54532.1 cobaltochelatase subunit CobT [Parvularcula sp. LCG005]
MADKIETPLDRFKRVLAQTTRAIAADPESEVTYGGDQSRVTGRSARIPMPPRRLDDERVAIARGFGDGAALRLAHHDEVLHARLSPQNNEGRAVYAALEDMRIEAIGANALPGVGNNLDAALEKRFEDKGYRRMEDRQNIPMPEIIQLLAREVMTGRPVPASAANLVDQWRDEIMAKAGPALDALRDPQAIDNQALFSTLARQLIDDLQMGDEKGEEKSDEDDGEDDTPTDDGDDDDQDEDQPDESDEDNQDSEDEVPDFGESPESGAEAEEIGEMEEDKDSRPDEHGMSPTDTPPKANDDSGERYHAYTHEFDEIAAPQELCDDEELSRLRNMLDNQLAPLQAVVGRLANRLHRRLLAQQNRAWQFDIDEGMLDAARLARIIADPMQPLSYKQEKEQAFRDTTVTLLIDNSGSMRGRPITVAALCADILARTLERCAVKVEILGFTTKAWKGGQSREKWVLDGRPRFPGRLNDLRHIVYKPANVPWRRAKDNLGLMLKEGLLKENIDGEALMWAHDRLVKRPEARRILMVISDGAPVDDTTSSANGGAYLDRHLREVIGFIENRSPVELLAIGIGHDVTRFYRRALTIADVDQLAGAMTEQLADLFEDDRSAPQRRRA